MSLKGNVFLSAAMSVPLAAMAGVKQINAPVQLDGKLDEAVWQDAEWIGDFMIPDGRPSVKATGSRKPKVDTQFAMMTDGRALYVGIKAEHDLMEEMKNLPPDGQWACEACEVFLVPSGGAFEYYHFLVCHPGQTWAMFYSEGGHIRPDPFGPVWDRAIADTEKGWTAEIRIPLSSLYMTRNTNWARDWRINVSRTYKKKGNGLGENSCWADVHANYGEVKTFRDYGPFPLRRAEDDVFIRSATAETSGLQGGKPAGTLKVSVYVAKGGDFVFTSPYSKPEQVTLKDGNNEIGVAAVFPENGRHATRLTLKRLSDGTVCGRDYPVRVDYQAIRVKLTTPQFRNNFYPGQKADRVCGAVKTVAADPVTLTLEGPGFAKQTITMTKPGEFTFDTTGFAFGDATLTATSGKDVLTKRIRRLPPLPEGEHASWVENGNLVVDGRPTVMRNLYAEGFCGGKAFDRKYDADKRSGKLHATTNIIECANIDPGWLAKELKYTECRKDVKPSKTMLDALDKAIAGRRKDGCYYYGVDEPECHGISAVYMEHVLDYMAEKDPYHVVICCCRSGETYGNTADVFAPHPYLNPENRPDGRRTYSRDPNQLGHFVDAYHPEAHPDKCIGGAPTCYAAKEYPTLEEYVLNYWCEFVRGAKMMLPYAYHDMGDRPQLYEGTIYMFESIEALEDVLLYGARKTLYKTENAECAVWTMPSGDRVFALLNFTQQPQTVKVDGLWGSYREFRGTRTFSPDASGAVTVSLKPHEVVVASEKPYDAGLRSAADVKAEIDALNHARTHRGNQLLHREDDMEIRTSTGRKGPWWDTARELFDGTLDVIGWYHFWGDKPKFYEIMFKKGLAPKFNSVRVFGIGHEDYALSVPDGKGGWTRLTPVETKVEGLGITHLYDRTLEPLGVRFDFPGKAVEVYEMELPEVDPK